MSLDKGVKFGDYHSYRDFGLILMSVDNPNPEPKFNFIEVMGSSEVIDLTEAFGEVGYNQRTLTFKFKCFDRYDTRYDKNGIIANALHGQKLRITLDDDPDTFYLGRVDFKTWQIDRKSHVLTFECVCEPYRYDIITSAEPWVWNTFSFVNSIIRGNGNIQVNGETSTTLIGTNKIIYPKIKASADMEVSLDDGEWVQVKAGSTTMYDLPIPRGEVRHEMRIRGVGNISIEVRGVSL